MILCALPHRILCASPGQGQGKRLSRLQRVRPALQCETRSTNLLEIKRKPLQHHLPYNLLQVVPEISFLVFDSTGCSILGIR
eukprot:1229864-Rhodomonas_salina.1